MEPHETAMLVIRHAVENVSREPVTDDDIIAILRGEGGRGSHLRAVFGDVSLQSIAAAGAAAGIPLRDVLAAYQAAKATALAANPELDAAIRDRL